MRAPRGILRGSLLQIAANRFDTAFLSEEVLQQQWYVIDESRISRVFLVLYLWGYSSTCRREALHTQSVLLVDYLWELNCRSV